MQARRESAPPGVPAPRPCRTEPCVSSAPPCVPEEVSHAALGRSSYRANSDTLEKSLSYCLRRMSASSPRQVGRRFDAVLSGEQARVAPCKPRRTKASKDRPDWYRHSLQIRVAPTGQPRPFPRAWARDLFSAVAGLYNGCWLLAHPVASTEVGGLRPGLGLLQHRDDLLLGEALPSHRSSSRRAA